MIAYGSEYPLGRVGKVSNTNAAIAYSADKNSASFLTEISLPVDGGVIISGLGYSSRIVATK